ncbi:unnamed protein product [Caenorhabditis angaria]|uniref:Calnexin n=1 Tax=Caenorhabditis angaria TaxID=860376 RepID=A0A9P1IKF1_9PELO|nr:unnamed protein product [Caenorhabditis angaria]
MLLLSRKWVIFYIFMISTITFASSSDEFEELVETEDEPIPQESVEEEEKEKYQPAQFVAPHFGEQSSSQPLFFDYFPANRKIGEKWVKSSAEKYAAGVLAIEAPKTVTLEGDLGLVVKTKARHHAIAAKLDKPFNFDATSADKLVVQYDVKYEEGQECGGGYLKLLSEGAEKNLADFQDQTPYTIMFGPDKCGSNGKVHLIFRYRNPKNGSIDEYHATQSPKTGTTYWDDHKTHLYTFVFKPNGEYNVNVDSSTLFYGNILNDVIPHLTPPKEIFDPSDVKPSDWDDRAEIEDETASKPEDWDENEPKEVVDENASKPSDWNEEENELIADSEAIKPADWDEEMDGEWEPPMIDNPLCKGISGCGLWKPPTIKNPKYKGKWIRPKIANPAFKGVWSARLIENPHYFEPTPFDGLTPITAVGIEMWTMSENIVFDNILITTSVEDAAEIAQQTYSIKKSEEAKLAAANGEGSGILGSIFEAAEEKPWLWAVYILCLILPVIFFAVFIFGRKSKPAPVNYGSNKRNEDDVTNLGDEDEEEDESQPGPSGTQNIAASPEEDQEDEDLEEIPGDVPQQKTAENSSAEEDVEVIATEEIVGKKSPKQTGAKRRVARKD